MDNVSEIMHVTRLFLRLDKRFSENEVVAFEELIEGDFRTFVDEKGRMAENGSEILAALCHFSYHYSNGEYILTNLKGVKNGPDHEDKPNTFCLTTPIFHSKSKSYGPADRGQTGIQEFFETHHCSAVCQNLMPGIATVSPVVPPSAPFYETNRDQNQIDTKPEAAPSINHACLVLPPSYEESESQKVKWAHEEGIFIRIAK